ncbi:MAG TPA: ABC transporter permease [Clostridiales bacterium]|nr:ABC transporter permease [Clostridiales bacterium]
MSAYLSLFRIRFLHNLQYRTAALAGLATQYAWGFMRLLALRAFYAENPAAFPLTFAQAADYVWLQQAFLALYIMWDYDPDIIESVRGGHIAYDLVRPVDMYARWFATTMARRVARAALRCAPILLVAFVLPDPMRLHLPASMLAFALYVLSTMLSVGVASALTTLVYIAHFQLLNFSGLRLMVAAVVDMLSGFTIPLPFYPQALQNVLNLLPFASMHDLPLRLYSGHIAGMAAVQGVALQAFWLAMLLLVGHRWMGRQLQRVIVQGG